MPATAKAALPAGQAKADSLDPIERYLATERALWDRYELEPTERFIEVGSPAVRLRIREVGTGEPVVPRARHRRPGHVALAREPAHRPALHHARPSGLGAQRARRLLGQAVQHADHRPARRCARRPRARPRAHRRRFDRRQLGAAARAEPSGTGGARRAARRRAAAARGPDPHLHQAAGISGRRRDGPDAPEAADAASPAAPDRSRPEPRQRAHSGRVHRLAPRARPRHRRHAP